MVTGTPLPPPPPPPPGAATAEFMLLCNVRAFVSALQLPHSTSHQKAACATTRPVFRQGLRRRSRRPPDAARPLRMLTDIGCAIRPRFRRADVGGPPSTMAASPSPTSVNIPSTLLRRSLTANIEPMLPRW